MQFNNTKSLRFQLKKIFFVTLGIGSLNSYPVLVLAQPYPSHFEQIKARHILTQKDPPDRGTPPTSEGTGSRGECLDKQNLFPLTPLVGSDRLKLTINQHPTLLVYVPYTRQEASKVEFSLQDGDNEVYHAHIQLPTTPGIMSIKLPQTTPPLAIGKQYRWYFDINCPSSKASDEFAAPASLTGLVQRIIPSLALEKELKTAKTPLERVKIYAKYHIWFEALTELAQQRLNDPQNPILKKVWVDLLSQIGLEKIAQQPII